MATKTAPDKAHEICPNESRYYQHEIEDLKKNPAILPQNKDDILEFLTYLKDKKGGNVNMRRGYLSALKVYAAQCRKPFKKMQKEDIEGIFTHIKNTYTAATAKTYKSRIKAFYKRLYDYNLPAYWIKKPYDGGLEIYTAARTKTYEDDTEFIPTREQVRELIAAADSPRDKALLANLPASGCRPTEFLTADLQDYVEEDGLATLRVYGSNGQSRTTHIRVEGMVYMREWINQHPFKDNPKAPLFISQRKNYGKRLSYLGMEGVLERAKNILAAKLRAEKKDPWPLRQDFTLKSFRKYRDTCLHEDGFTIAEINREQGRAKGSRVSEKVYIKVREDHIKEKLRGDIKANEEERKRIEEAKKNAAPRECSSCGRMNPPDSVYCNCGLILDAKTAAQVRQEKEKAAKTYAAILRLLERRDMMDELRNEIEKS